MKIKRFDATISTSKLRESKEFYMKHFGFQLVYESDWYIELIAAAAPAVGVSFTLPQREAGEFFKKGLILSFEVDDVDAEYRRLKAEGLEIVQDLVDKPWGERSFVVDDPNGAHIYKEIYDSFK
jgi:uncharacterized glyoxalase superfamily protein PhnB